MEYDMRVKVKIENKELEDIFADMDEAMEKIHDCYFRLRDLGVVEFAGKEAASGN